MAAIPAQQPPLWMYPQRTFNLTSGLQDRNLGAYVLQFYQLQLHNLILAGEKRPAIIPLVFLGPVIIPAVYLLLPHTKSPWLYQARFAVLALIYAVSWDEIRRGSSYNPAAAYGVGLLQAWGVVWSTTLLVWMRPQFEARRVEKRRRRVGVGVGGDGKGEVDEKGVAAEGAVAAVDAPDEDVARSIRDGYEYYWQRYPEDGSFWTRLDWVMDLVTNMRGTGWNWGINIIPSFPKPKNPISSTSSASPNDVELVDLTSIPTRTKLGYVRYTTTRAFLTARLLSLLRDYIFLDFASTFMVKDPYFCFGPGYDTTLHANRLPPFLAYIASIHPYLLFSWRSLIAFFGVFCGLHIIFSTSQLISKILLAPLLGTRSELWHYPSINGRFTLVFEKGLAGFWGGWWHQTFRVAFSAPSLWLQRHGLIDLETVQGKLVASVIAFAVSGFIHTLGSITCVPSTQPWGPPLFFMLNCVGTLGQDELIRRVFGTLSAAKQRSVGFQGLRGAANVLVAFLWMHNTQFWFVDDFGRSALFLFEPVPVSFWRMAGMGKPGDSWFRWADPPWPFLFVGRTWWESGIAV